METDIIKMPIIDLKKLNSVHPSLDLTELKAVQNVGQLTEAVQKCQSFHHLP